MSFTTEQLAVLNEMIASGVLRTKFEGREIEYRSMTDLIRARDEVVRGLAASGGTQAPAYVDPVFSRGC